MTAVMKRIGWGMSACVAVVALALTGGVASAQQKAPEPPKADAKKAEPPKADAKKAEPAAKAPAKKAEPAKKPPSPCAGIEEPACLANTECMWVKEVVTKAGQKRKAHCQKKPTPPAAKKDAAPKADAKKAEPAPKAAAPAPAAPKAAAPAAPAPAPKAPAPAAPKQ
jgi:hypothetical protein